MEITAQKSLINGSTAIPASKSHTIRAIVIGALAEGESIIRNPLDSLDTRSAAAAVKAFGADVRFSSDAWSIRGLDGEPHVPDDIIDVGNSGTTLYMIMGAASLTNGWTVLTGDHQIRRRTAAPLITALRPLGVETFSTRGNGMAPLLVRGKMSGGSSSVAGISSQYLSSLLLACPLATGDTDLIITVLNERPYVHMTLKWLAEQGIYPEIDLGMTAIKIKGGQHYRAFDRTIPADFSSAAFPLCAGVLAGGTVTLTGLEMDDPQGDREVITILRKMGAIIESNDQTVTVRGGNLKGIDVDMNAIPDAIPILSVCACFAGGTTVLHNVPQARIKETDRIARHGHRTPEARRGYSRTSRRSDYSGLRTERRERSWLRRSSGCHGFDCCRSCSRWSGDRGYRGSSKM